MKYNKKNTKKIQLKNSVPQNQTLFKFLSKNPHSSQSIHQLSLRTKKDPKINLPKTIKIPHSSGQIPKTYPIDPIFLYPNNPQFRDYQFQITSQCVKYNTLVCLPTGLGKTHIASILITNFTLWFPQTPTRPLVRQQRQSLQWFYQKIGVQNVFQMNGQINSTKRTAFYQTKKVFFATPQTFTNDLKENRLNPQGISLIIFDQAHRAVGNSAYAQAVRFLNPGNYCYRIVGLSATPGNQKQKIQQVITNLNITKMIYKDEQQPDVKKYFFNKLIIPTIIDPPSIIIEVQKLLDQMVIPYIRYMVGVKLVDGWVLKSKINSGLFFVVFKAYNQRKDRITQQIYPYAYSSLKIIKFLIDCKQDLTQHGYQTFKSKFFRGIQQMIIQDSQNDDDNESNSLSNWSIQIGGNKQKKVGKESKQNKKFKPLNQVLPKQFRQKTIQSTSYKRIKQLFNPSSNVINHPKLQKLKNILDQFFKQSYRKFQQTQQKSNSSNFSLQDNNNNSFNSKQQSQKSCPLAFTNNSFKGSKVIVFTHFRSTAHQIRTYLSTSTIIKCQLFHGQSKTHIYEDKYNDMGQYQNSKQSTLVLNQRQQISIIQRFKNGQINTLIATSIGEQGLDIGEVDCIVCYDGGNKSPIRSIQRFGRTGRKRDGVVHILLMKGTEQEDYKKGQQKIKTMKKLLKQGQFQYYNYNNSLLKEQSQVRVEFYDNQKMQPISSAIKQKVSKQPKIKKRKQKKIQDQQQLNSNIDESYEQQLQWNDLSTNIQHSLEEKSQNKKTKKIGQKKVKSKKQKSLRKDKQKNVDHNNDQKIQQSVQQKKQPHSLQYYEEWLRDLNIPQEEYEKQLKQNVKFEQNRQIKQQIQSVQPYVNQQIDVDKQQKTDNQEMKAKGKKRGRKPRNKNQHNQAVGNMQSKSNQKSKKSCNKTIKTPIKNQNSQNKNSKTKKKEKSRKTQQNLYNHHQVNQQLHSNPQDAISFPFVNPAQILQSQYVDIQQMQTHFFAMNQIGSNRKQINNNNSYQQGQKIEKESNKFKRTNSNIKNVEMHVEYNDQFYKDNQNASLSLIKSKEHISLSLNCNQQLEVQNFSIDNLQYQHNNNSQDKLNNYQISYHNNQILQNQGLFNQIIHNNVNDTDFDYESNNLQIQHFNGDSNTNNTLLATITEISEQSIKKTHLSYSKFDQRLINSINRVNSINNSSSSKKLIYHNEKQQYKHKNKNELQNSNMNINRNLQQNQIYQNNQESQNQIEVKQQNQIVSGRQLSQLIYQLFESEYENNEQQDDNLQQEKQQMNEKDEGNKHDMNNKSVQQDLNKNEQNQIVKMQQYCQDYQQRFHYKKNQKQYSQCKNYNKIKCNQKENDKNSNGNQLSIDGKENQQVENNYKMIDELMQQWQQQNNNQQFNNHQHEQFKQHRNQQYRNIKQQKGSSNKNNSKQIKAKQQTFDKQQWYEQQQCYKNKGGNNWQYQLLNDLFDQLDEQQQQNNNMLNQQNNNNDQVQQFNNKKGQYSNSQFNKGNKQRCQQDKQNLSQVCQQYKYKYKYKQLSLQQKLQHNGQQKRQIYNKLYQKQKEEQLWLQKQQQQKQEQQQYQQDEQSSSLNSSMILEQIIRQKQNIIMNNNNKQQNIIIINSNNNNYLQ